MQFSRRTLSFIGLACFAMLVTGYWIGSSKPYIYQKLLMVEEVIGLKFIPKPPPPAPVDYSYDFDNDPLGKEFHKKVPALLTTILKRYQEKSDYREFPLPADEHAAFKKDVKKALRDAIGGQWVLADPHVRQSGIQKLFDYESLKSIRHDGVVLELGIIKIHATDDQVPVVKCIPHVTPAPAVIMFSGHPFDSGLRELYIDKASYQHAAALELCKAGFITTSIEKIDSGYLSELFQYRDERWREGVLADDEAEAATMINAIGDYPIMARQLMANIAALELLAADGRTKDPAKIGAGGVSLGGWLSLQTALVSPRISAIANYGGVYSYVDAFIDGKGLDTFAGINCDSQTLPGLWKLGDQRRFIYAVAPAVMMTGYGKNEAKDYLSSLRYFYPGIVEQYKLLNQPDNLEVFVHEGGHEMPVEKTIEFFKRRLAGE